MKLRLCFHDRCFDGAASAAVFTRFYRERIHPDAQVYYTGMTHKASHPFEDGIFDGDENAIVDFKYSSSPLLTWWFDHHQSAFLTPQDAEHFRSDRSGKKFYDPEYKSCTKFLATIASEKFGFNAEPLVELIHWGNIIDGAQFATPEIAVGLAEPAMQLALVIEAAPEADLVPKLIPFMATISMAEMVQLPMVQKHLGNLLAMLNTGQGSASRIERLIVAAQPPSLDDGEITDKGYVNQRRVLANRPELVELLYGDPVPEKVITPARKRSHAV